MLIGVVFDEVIMELHAGSGGTDSKLFIHDLAAAYIKYAKLNNLDGEILETNTNNIILMFSGNGATELFYKEAGQAVVQRVPPTESKGRRQTSYVNVAILPVVTEQEYDIPLSDLEIDTQRGKVKAGGQHGNVTDSCVRITHKPTRLSCFISSERSQLANKLQALKVIRSRVEQYYKSLEPQYKAEASQRGGKKRTYNFIDSRAVDHELGTKTTRVQDVIGKGMFQLLHP